jgi:hypothetical protein
MGADLPSPSTSETILDSLSPQLGLNWQHALPAAAISGIISTVLMMIPFAGPALGMLAGGSLSVMLYRRRVPQVQLNGGLGGRLGALSGLIGFAVFSIFTAVQVLVFHAGSQLRGDLIDSVKQAAARAHDPQSQPFLDYLSTPPGLQLVMVAGFAVMLAMFLVLSSIGGAVSAALMRRKTRP